MADKTGSKGSESPLRKLKRYWGKFWYFFWEEDSALSWILNILVAFFLIKGVIYPGLGFMLQTSHPVVAVISNSMNHHGSFEQWWSGQSSLYSQEGITQDEFLSYRFTNGFNRGDIMVLRGTPAGSLKLGDVIVYTTYVRKEPIIHRIVDIRDENGVMLYRTKGDANPTSYPFESRIMQRDIIGKAALRVPYLGWIKISFVCMIDGITRKDSFINCMRGA